MKTIWQVPQYLPYVQPCMTDTTLADAERIIGYKLPKEYIDILKIQNGGYIRFTLPETLNRRIFGIGPYYPSLTQYDWSYYEGSVGFELNGLFPFDGDGHWFLCLDYRENEVEPEITLIDAECNFEQTISKSFEEYLKLLVINKEYKFVIETNLPIEDVVNEISSIGDIKFEAPSSFDHGYPIYKGQYNKSWIWISSNKVPSGFVRENHNRYEELKLLMLLTSTRCPEDPGNFLFIQVSENIETQNLFESLTKNGIKISEAKVYFEGSRNR